MKIEFGYVQFFFCNTFGISKNIPINAIQSKSPNGVCVVKDKRKERSAHNTTPQDTIDAINSFLREFPKTPSHYCH